MISSTFKMFVSKTLLTACLGIAAASLTFAQTPTQQSPGAAVNQTPTQLNESFELNIPDRRIIEKNFKASTNVELNAPERNDLRVGVGVALHAETIDVRLRNVFGTVRFQGSLQRILDLINLRLRTIPQQ